MGSGGSGGGRWARLRAIRRPPPGAKERGRLRRRRAADRRRRARERGGDPLGEADDRLAAGVAAEQQADSSPSSGSAGSRKAPSSVTAAQDNVRLSMRPGRDNIAAPDLPAGLAWVGAEPESMPALTAGGPALVHFVEFAQLNSVRTLPYLAEWVAPLPRGGPERDRRPGAALPLRRRARAPSPPAWRALGVEFPVAIDAEHELWSAYGCEGWPSLFLWSLGGALAWVHFGEGEYRATEEAIQDELREIDALQAAARADGAAARPPTPPAPGSSPPPPSSSPAAPGSGPGPRARTARSWRSTTRPAAPSRRSRARARSRSRSTASAHDDRGHRPRPLRPGRASAPRGAQLDPPPRPGYADLVGQLRPPACPT